MGSPAGALEEVGAAAAGEADGVGGVAARVAFHEGGPDGPVGLEVVDEDEVGVARAAGLDVGERVGLGGGAGGDGEREEGDGGGEGSGHGSWFRVSRCGWRVEGGR